MLTESRTGWGSDDESAGADALSVRHPKVCKDDNNRNNRQEREQTRTANLPIVLQEANEVRLAGRKTVTGRTCGRNEIRAKTETDYPLAKRGERDVSD